VQIALCFQRQAIGPSDISDIAFHARKTLDKLAFPYPLFAGTLKMSDDPSQPGWVAVETNPDQRISLRVSSTSKNVFMVNNAVRGPTMAQMNFPVANYREIAIALGSDKKSWCIRIEDSTASSISEKVRCRYSTLSFKLLSTQVGSSCSCVLITHLLMDRDAAFMKWVGDGAEPPQGLEAPKNEYPTRAHIERALVSTEAI
jgi:hypothetical protein